MRQKRTHAYTRILVVGIAAVLLILWIAVGRRSNSMPQSDQTLPSSTQPQIPETTYRNDEYGFTLEYDESYFLKSEATSSYSWRVDTTDPGDLLVRLTLQKSFEPNTNFSEGFVTVGASKDPVAMSNCLRAQDGETASGVTQIGNTTFFTFTSDGAGAGNFYETKSYRVIQNGACIALESTIHSTNIGNYDPSQGIKAFDRAKVEQMLTGVVNTFRFE